MDTLHARNAWTPAGWQAALALDIDGRGRIRAVREQAPAQGDTRADWLLPGLPNLHSHAFQRAMAGLAERQTHPEDSFWTWRELMYRFAGRITPESLYAIASQLYVEMLEAGYTSVCEFHYLHHAPDGHPYEDPAAMSRALIAAARDTGIRLVLLPVLYVTGGFDGRPLADRQRRFGHDVEAFLSLLQILQSDANDELRIGVALHSLRAVPPAALDEVLAGIGTQDLPIHIHIAEQIGEVQECQALRGARPVEWLLANAPVDERWTLVHATHLVDAEIQGIAASGATVAICPTTEANLGDGLFPLRDYLDAGGSWGVGSDSHVSVSVVEELRWLEYGQRLASRRRNIAVSAGQPSTGERLLSGALAGGALSCGLPLGSLAEGGLADLVMLDAEAPALAGATTADVIDRWIFAGNRNLVREVHVGGRRLVAEGRHHAHEAVAARYAQVLRRLLADA